MQLQMWIIHKTCGRIQKETNKTRGMTPIELGHGLKCWKKILTCPQFGNEDHLLGSKRKEI
jgi:hypothetical protein